MSIFSDIRNGALMTQAQFGRKVDRSNVWVCQIERNPAKMPLGIVRKYYQLADEEGKEAVREYIARHFLAG